MCKSNVSIRPVPASKTQSPVIMRLLAGMLMVAWLAVLLPAHAQGPDDQYMVVYNLVEQADALNASGKAAPALAKYREAKTALLRFQRTNPTWNTKVVSFRVNYLTEKIAALTEKAPVPATAGATTNTQAPPTGTKQAPSKSTSQVKLLEAGAEPRQVFRLHPKPGDKQTADITLKMAMATQAGEMQVPAVKIPAIKMTLDMTVKSVSAEGEIAYETVTTDARVADDPDAAPMIAAALKSIPASLKGQSENGTMSDRGLIKKAETKAAPGADPQARQFIEQFNEASGQFVLPLPEEQVGPGAKWEFKKAIKAQGMTIDQTATYQLVSVKGDQVTVKMTLAQHAANQKIQSPEMQGMTVDLIKMTGSSTGEATFDMNRLLPSAGTLDGHAEIAMAMNMGNQKQKMTMKMDQNVRVEAK